MVEQLWIGKAKAGLGRTVDDVGKFAKSKSAQLAGLADDLKGAAGETVEKLTARKPDPYEQAVAEYNVAYIAMNDKGLSLLRQRERSADLIELVEIVVNSIANTPKSFAAAFDEIDVHRADFLDATEFAQKDLEAARQAAVGAGAGFATGVAVASMAPTAAMWVATTFGVASTGTAISTLSGAAATSASLAWLGGGALAAGGGGTAAGSALLALAGPIGWTFAGATLLVSIALFAKRKHENRRTKQDVLSAVKRNTALVMRMDAQIDDVLQRTVALRELLLGSYAAALKLFGANFITLSSAQQSQLAALVNNTKACAALLSTRVGTEENDD